MKVNPSPLLVVSVVFVVSLCWLPTAAESSEKVKCEALSLEHAVPELDLDNLAVTQQEFIGATDAAIAHCVISGEIDRRVGIDGQQYAIGFRFRLPVDDWNGRLYMEGGGGTNGKIKDPLALLAEGFATIGTDGGHDNTRNYDESAGGIFAFGRDPQARRDFAYNAYDLVVKLGKYAIQGFYGSPPQYSYFEGCSEGGREALLMAQKFPQHFDGIVSGAPAIRLPLGPVAGLYTNRLFSELAVRSGLLLPDGSPAIGMTYSDSDLMLVRESILEACDALDGLEDGIVDDLASCDTPRVAAQLSTIKCSVGKNNSCLTEDQLITLKKAFAGPKDSEGSPVYSSWPWDAGVSGLNGESHLQDWRKSWLGSASKIANDGAKLKYAGAVAAIYTTPPNPISTDSTLSYSLNYDLDGVIESMHATTDLFPESVSDLYITDQTNLRLFVRGGGKLMMFHGASDSVISMNETVDWYTSMVSDTSAPVEFSQLYLVPGMGHCRGGPGMDRFKMLQPLMQWVEKGVEPSHIVAETSTPGFFGVETRSRKLCPFPEQSRYRGHGDINHEASFECFSPN